ncbi:hypothetical protein EYV94_21370 [Puteibacter caeruleilacunae]|nr:hypothetical protein EYV94_21370 [Puteibacter caeruleilacunae]
MNYLMTIDLGSTSIKVIIFDLSGRLLSIAQRPMEKVVAIDNPQFIYWNPKLIWKGVCDAAREALAKLPMGAYIKGITVTGMGMDGIPVDKTGSPLFPFISWHDDRTIEQAEEWKSSVGELYSFQRTGFAAWHIMSVMRMKWMAKNHPEVMDHTYKWLLMVDYINFKLSDVMVTDRSMASCTMLFDQNKQQWSDELIEQAGLCKSILPEVKQSGSHIGNITDNAADATGIPLGTPIYLGGHDHICSTVPLGGFKNGSLIDIIGTWESVMATTPNLNLSEKLLDYQICVESHVIPDYFVAWGGAVAGESVEWMRKLFKGYGMDAEFEWETIQEALESGSSMKNNVIFLPYISGAACPVGDSLAKGAFVGLSSTTTKADMFKAVFEGLNFQFLDILKAFEASFGAKFEEIIVTGGGTRNDFWLQSKADISGLPVVKYDIEEATALGAAILAGIGAGCYKDAEDAFFAIPKDKKIIEPNAKISSYMQSKYSIYQGVYPALKHINQELKSL